MDKSKVAKLQGCKVAGLQKRQNVAGCGLRVAGKGKDVARCRLQVAGFGEDRVLGVLAVLVLLVSFLCAFAPGLAEGAQRSSVETAIVRFVQEIYTEGEDIQVRINSLPVQLKQKAHLRDVTFSKIPDVNGDGVCVVEYDTGDGRKKNVYVPFKVFVKRKLFVLREAGKKGDLISKADLATRETYMNGKMTDYPGAQDDVIGKALKKDVPGNTVLTGSVLEDRIATKRGETVNIIVENKQLTVLSKGKIMEKGRIGDTVRVKNLSSGREITGRLVAENTVKVEF